MCATHTNDLLTISMYRDFFFRFCHVRSCFRNVLKMIDNNITLKTQDDWGRKNSNRFCERFIDLCDLLNVYAISQIQQERKNNNLMFYESTNGYHKKRNKIFSPRVFLCDLIWIICGCGDLIQSFKEHEFHGFKLICKQKENPPNFITIHFL